MNVGASRETDTEASEVVQPGMRALNGRANLSGAVAARFPAPGDTGWRLARSRCRSCSPFGRRPPHRKRR